MAFLIALDVAMISVEYAGLEYPQTGELCLLVSLHRREGEREIRTLVVGNPCMV
jgi:hypothetical protein